MNALRPVALILVSSLLLVGCGQKAAAPASQHQKTKSPGVSTGTPVKGGTERLPQMSLSVNVSGSATSDSFILVGGGLQPFSSYVPADDQVKNVSASAGAGYQISGPVGSATQIEVLFYASASEANAAYQAAVSAAGTGASISEPWATSSFATGDAEYFLASHGSEEAVIQLTGLSSDPAFQATSQIFLTQWEWTDGTPLGGSSD